MSSYSSSRLKVIEPETVSKTPDFAEAVREGLTSVQKTLPSRFLYDKSGSNLFERITELEEYYLTECEREILDAHSEDIADALGDAVSLVELGGGNSEKTRILIDAVLRRQNRLHFTNIDISTEYLVESAEELLNDYEELHVSAVAAEFLDALDHLPEANSPRAVLLMGSNIGNFTREEAHDLLETLRGMMSDEDCLLVGFDLVKQPAIVQAAYNDSDCVTAQFNLNILERVNRELGANFDLSQFRHDAPWVPEKGRIEMRLYADEGSNARIDALDLTVAMRPGEYIHTENSCKFKPDEFDHMLSMCGLKRSHYWTDSREWFRVARYTPGKMG